MMVLCSGLGPRMEAQDQVSVGVGALAGSTIMLVGSTEFREGTEFREFAEF